MVVRPLVAADEEDNAAPRKRKFDSITLNEPKDSQSKKPKATEQVTNIGDEGVSSNRLTPQEAGTDKIDAIYLFNVGQGNSQLIVYAEGRNEPFGVIYDCGSSAQTVSDKILQIRFANVDVKPFLVAQKQGQSDNKELFNVINVTKLEEESSSDSEASNSSKKEESSTGSEASDKDKKIVKKDLKPENLPNIKKTIKDKGLKHLFVFLSHPDNDHINMISKSIPKELETSFILCGDFFLEGQDGENKTSVQNLFKYITERKKRQTLTTNLILPHFWEHKKYTQIKDFIQNFSDSKKLSKKLESELYTFKSHTPPHFSGDFVNFLKHAKYLDESLQLSSEELDTFKNKIFIWSLNKISDDPNRQSPIVSFYMPNLQKTIICTGDAHDDVFGDIVQSREKPELEKLIQDYIQGTILIMLPHHGSDSNRSSKMIKLFKPHILGISAGSGGQYGHPRTDVIQFYKKLYKDSELDKKIEDFWNKFNLTGAFRYFSFNKDMTRLHTLEEASVDNKKKLPILCSNILGTIEILKDSFSAQFTNQFMFGGNYYEISFANSIQDNLLSIKDDEIEYNNESYIQGEKEGENLFITKDKTKLLIRLNIKEKQSDEIKQNKQSDEIKQKKQSDEIKQKYYLGTQIQVSPSKEGGSNANE